MLNSAFNLMTFCKLGPSARNVGQAYSTPNVGLMDYSSKTNTVFGCAHLKIDHLVSWPMAFERWLSETIGSKFCVLQGFNSPVVCQTFAIPPFTLVQICCLCWMGACWRLRVHRSYRSYVSLYSKCQTRAKSPSGKFPGTTTSKFSCGFMPIGCFP